MSDPVSERSHGCQHCGRYFRRLEHLQRHVRTHTKEKPFACWCGLSFSRNDLLKRHCRVTHTMDKTADVNGHLPAPRLPPPSISFPVPPEYQHARTTIANVDGAHDLRHYLEETLAGRGSGQNFPSPSPRESSPSPYSSSLCIESHEHDSICIDNNTSHNVAPPEMPYQLPRRERKVEVTDPQVEEIGCRLAQLNHANNKLLLPSSQALTRYAQSFFDSFHLYLPFLHLSTMPFATYSHELLLSICTIGALYDFEGHRALTLFHAAKLMVFERMRGPQQPYQTGDIADSALPIDSIEANTPLSVSSPMTDDTGLELCQPMLLLIAFAIRSMDNHVIDDMWAMHGIMSAKLRQSGLRDNAPLPINDDDSSGNNAWVRWARDESARRTKIVAYYILNLAGSAFGISPPFPASELGLFSPCSESEWLAQSSAQWLEARQKANPPKRFADIILLSPSCDERQFLFDQHNDSYMGKCVILHRFCQDIATLRHASRIIDTPLLQSFHPMFNDIQSLVSTWMVSWPPEYQEGNCHVSKSISTIALAGVCYVRLAYVHNITRLLATRSSSELATMLAKLPLPQRSERLIPALQCAVAVLGSQVLKGLHVISRSRQFYSNIQELLCYGELAIFLSIWLLSLDNLESIELLQLERDILDKLSYLLRESHYHAFDSSRLQRLSSDWPRELAIHTLKVWGFIFRGAPTQDIVHTIGVAFETYSSAIGNQL